MQKNFDLVTKQLEKLQDYSQSQFLLQQWLPLSYYMADPEQFLSKFQNFVELVQRQVFRPDFKTHLQKLLKKFTDSLYQSSNSPEARDDYELIDELSSSSDHQYVFKTHLKSQVVPELFPKMAKTAKTNDVGLSAIDFSALKNEDLIRSWELELEKSLPGKRKSSPTVTFVKKEREEPKQKQNNIYNQREEKQNQMEYNNQNEYNYYREQNQNNNYQGEKLNKREEQKSILKKTKESNLSLKEILNSEEESENRILRRNPQSSPIFKTVQRKYNVETSPTVTFTNKEQKTQKQQKKHKQEPESRYKYEIKSDSENSEIKPKKHKKPQPKKEKEIIVKKQIIQETEEIEEAEPALNQINASASEEERPQVQRVPKANVPLKEQQITEQPIKESQDQQNIQQIGQQKQDMIIQELIQSTNQSLTLEQQQKIILEQNSRIQLLEMAMQQGNRQREDKFMELLKKQSKTIKYLQRELRQANERIKFQDEVIARFSKYNQE
ncbi:histone-lysine_N-methyltransferase 2A-like isoform X1 [Hexamita inflata]|uniref:Histone-lysine N-methyltransferase 2A-like isoform X1 n=1 Tax=Hexamita inflata TaxID=28002 RepID=A0AA86NHH3_9EUKA|nr:histone-lysine N-methyltransferase 2A-like isoform X1 [Hexamita inflata]